MGRLDVVTVFTPRKDHEKWMDYGPLLTAQRNSVETLGHRHIVVSDHKYKQFRVFNTALPESLMFAILAGQIAFLEAWEGNYPVVLVDVDCLVARDLTPIFKHRSFDLGLTNRDAPHASPINNGVMYIAPGNKDAIIRFFRKAYSLCKDHWGGDQEAISLAAAPVPHTHGIEFRDGLRINFMTMLTYNTVPEDANRRFKHNPYVIHFKGEHRKSWMLRGPQNFIG